MRGEAQQLARQEGRPLRIVPHDSAVTLDYAPTRLNIFLTEDGQLHTMKPG